MSNRVKSLLAVFVLLNFPSSAQLQPQGSDCRGLAHTFTKKRVPCPSRVLCERAGLFEAGPRPRHLRTWYFPGSSITAETCMVQSSRLHALGMEEIAENW